MKTISVRLPDELYAEIEAEARARGISKAAAIRERLPRSYDQTRNDPLASVRDLIGSVSGGPPDLSARTKHYLREWGFGRDRS
jgi:hypothetical protein